MLSTLPSSLSRAPWRHLAWEASGNGRHRLCGGGGQRSSGGAGAAGETQERHSQDLLQVRQDHNWILSRSWWHDQRVKASVLLCSCSCRLGVDVLTCSNFFFCPRRYIFLEYSSPNQALEAVKNADGYKLDKQHTFRVNLFTDFDKYVCRITALQFLQIMWCI